MIVQVAGQQNCPNGENYFPCSCDYEDGGYVVVCNRTLVEDVAGVFKRNNPATLKTFRFILSSFESTSGAPISLPANLLNEHQVHYDIFLYCSSFSTKILIGPETFGWSKNFTEKFYVGYPYAYPSLDGIGCNFDGLDFHFLSGFNNLTSLSIYNSANLEKANWTTLPPLASLNTLSIYNSDGLNNWAIFPNTSQGLTNLYLQSSSIQNDPMDRILNWTLEHSTDTLKTLYIDNNHLTNIPRQIPNFKQLEYLNMDNQYPDDIATVPSGAFTFNAPVSNINCRGNGIAKIEPGAFQGID